jgi:subtilisin-like proprotein convertase family protein
MFALIAVTGRSEVTNNYTSGNLNQIIPNGDVFGISSTINATEGGSVLIADVSLTMDVSGGYNGDLYAYLVHDNTLAVLLNRVGRMELDSFGYGDNGLKLTFTTQNGLDIGSDIHQYQAVGGWGSYLIAGQLTGTGLWAADGRTTSPLSVVPGDSRTALLGNFVSNHEFVSGDWTLVVADLVGGGDSASTLNSWSLAVTYVPVPEPTSLALLAFGGLMLWRRFARRSASTRFISFSALFMGGVLFCAPTAARAITLTLNNPVDASSSATTGNAADTSAATLAQLLSGGGSAADLVGSAVSGSTRFAWNVTGDTLNTTADTRTLNASYSITFSLVPDQALTYDLQIRTSQNGAWTFLNDATTAGAAGKLSLSDVTGRINNVADANLTLPGLLSGADFSLNPGAPAGTAQEGAWGGNSTYNLTGLAGGNTYTLNFTFTSRATTPSSTTGDEVSMRYGLSSTLANVTADDYPGVGAPGPAVRNQALDGHFVTIMATVTSVPEPGTFALLGLGIASLLWLSPSTDRRRAAGKRSKSNTPVQ